jgi:hypothetical protein
MRLDMYAFTIDKAPKKPVDFKIKHPQALHFWRKHPKLLSSSCNFVAP